MLVLLVLVVILGRRQFNGSYSGKEREQYTGCLLVSAIPGHGVSSEDPAN